MGINKFNSEGYYDPTPYEALTNIVREEKTKQKKEAYRPLIFVSSPFAENMESNTIKARAYCRFAVEKQTIPVAPHLLYPQFMNEHNPKHRELGLLFGRVLLSKCKEVWVFGDRISSGMQLEIDKARKRRIPIRYFTEQCEEVSHI